MEMNEMGVATGDTLGIVGWNSCARSLAASQKHRGLYAEGRSDPCKIFIIQMKQRFFRLTVGPG